MTFDKFCRMLSYILCCVYKRVILILLAYRGENLCHEADIFEQLIYVQNGMRSSPHGHGMCYEINPSGGGMV